MPTTIAPPVCPPNPDAMCVCGNPLADHVEDFGRAGDMGDYCANGTTDTFQLVGGDSTECPDLTECSVCEVDLCTEHSPEFTTCAGGDGIHHLACQFECRSCSFEAGQEAQAERNSDR